MCHRQTHKSFHTVWLSHRYSRADSWLKKGNNNHVVCTTHWPALIQYGVKHKSLLSAETTIHIQKLNSNIFVRKYLPCICCSSFVLFRSIPYKTANTIMAARKRPARTPITDSNTTNCFGADSRLRQWWNKHIVLILTSKISNSLPVMYNLCNPETLVYRFIFSKISFDSLSLHNCSIFSLPMRRIATFDTCYWRTEHQCCFDRLISHLCFYIYRYRWTDIMW